MSGPPRSRRPPPAAALAAPVLAALALASAALLAADEAHAGGFDVFGFGSRGIALSNAMTAAADDHAALFYNPAGLTLRATTHLGADVYTAQPSLRVDLDRDPDDPALAPALVAPHGGINLGALFPLGDRLALGVAFGLPFKGLLDLELLDPQVPQWSRYDALPRKMQILGGLSFKPLPWLHLGAGFQSLARIDGGARFEMDLANETITRRDATIELIHTAAPTLGALVEPPFLEGLRLGASWRGALELSFDLPILFDFGQSADILLGVAGVTLYTPHQISAGLFWDLDPGLGWPIGVALDASLALWSLAPPPSLDLVVDVQGDAPEGLGLDEALDFESPPDPSPGFKDTLTLAGGVEWRGPRGVSLRSGYAFRPAAIAPQAGRNNYIDADAHIFGLGVGVSRPNPLEEARRPATFEVAGQLTLLERVEVDKDDPDDAVGGYSAGGAILTLSLTLRHDL